jgi:membrane peptidoglycan carboxypeptidase
LVVLVILAGIGVMVILYEKTPIPNEAQLTANSQSSVVYFANGKQMGTFDSGGVDRQLLTSTQIPTVMTEAMTAAEDRHFYTEGGVSVTGLARSVVEDVFGSGNLQGGSTITMQYAKNYYTHVNTGRNVKTKLKEIFIATKLGHYRSKQWVMTSYLNTVPFGTITYGLGAAAENYFDINLTDPGAKLSVAQAAMLAAMPNAPGYYNPDPSAGSGYTALVARWHYVLTNMVRDGNITQAEANAQTFPKLTPPPSGNGETGYTGYLMNMVLQQLEAPKADGGYGLTQQQVDTKGYKIKTTFNLTKVKQLARTINQSKAAIRTVNGTKFPGYDRFGSVIEDSKTGAIIAIYGGPGYGAPNCKVTDCDLNMAEAAEPVGSSFKTYVLAAAVQEGMDVFSSKLNGYSPIWIPIGPTDTATQMQNSPLSRPPGCGAPKNLAVCFSTNGTTYYVFDEPTEDSNMPLAVNDAAAISSDPAFEDLAHRDGISSVVSMAKQFGVGQNSFVNPCPTSEERHDSTVGATIADCNDLTGPAPSSTQTGNGLALNFDPNSTDKAAHNAGTPGSVAIALGENPLTPIEQASTFATLADDGVYHTPHVIAAISHDGANMPLNVKTRQVLNPQQAADVDYALSFDNNNSQGTAEVNVPYRRGDVVGKTGTIGEQDVASQAWFIGGLPRGLAMSVALFTNLPGHQNLDNLDPVGGTQGSQGGAWPAFTWNAFMTKYNNNAPQIALTTFPQKSGPPFSTWILVKAKKVKLPTCRPFQFTNCTQPKNCNNPFGNGNGNGNCNPNGNNSPSPNPSSSCNPFQQQCTSPSPSVSPSPSCTPNGPGGGGCTSQQPGVAGTTMSMSIGSLSSDQVTTLAEVMALKQRALVIPAVT